ncbi:uncharacterized protein LOC127871308 [Dreissena polymorpha]|uniref:Protein kinase domain-containing protein n=1 Tax=Dreissena polymorpha TaxID=45954 RepID=A0A9D4R7Q5_DREPO|nr:uncharacterized protein LOC127871308 [Dreissena polymorpha]KAH3856922.1 hypothetical protein DPMN_099517 [Dreissena polymorpha]
MAFIDGGNLGVILSVLTVAGFVLNVVSIAIKVCKDFSNPKLWKYSLLCQNVANCFVSSGLGLFLINLQVGASVLCNATGFFLLFGIFQCSLSYLTTGIILLSVQNPGKASSLSTFHRSVVAAIVVPEVLVGAVISFLPYVSKSLFDTSIDFDVACFPIRDHGQQGEAFGTLLVTIWWIILAATAVCDTITVLKLWKFNNRVNSAQNNVWQTQLIIQGKTLIKISLIEHAIFASVVLLITLSVYADQNLFEDNKTWIVMTSLAVSALFHGVFSNVSDVMWTACCCRDAGAVKEPQRKLKKLELMKIEGPGRLRMKATWTVGKHATKRGMMKVYGTQTLRAWAQEIVMLGMLRRTQHPSLVQCLWTSSSNPYYETMTLISGDIVTSDSRIICLEMTNGGTLHDFLQKCELPLPEPCQRMIVHDIAEGLFYLHHENILHNNLTSACVYLKGSLQSMVLRAAVGDFEEAQIYGTLQQSLDTSTRDKKYFFLPDVRSFALIALEILGKMCEKKFQNRYVNYNSEHVPLKLNLENTISDEDDEFEAQYCYDVQDTRRMFEAIHSDEVEDSEDEPVNETSEFQVRRKANGSLENLMDHSRPMSPVYTGRNLGTPESVHRIDEHNMENETIYKTNDTVFISKSPKHVEQVAEQSPSRCKSPEVLIPVKPSSKSKSRKARKGISKSSEDILNKDPFVAPQRKSLSSNEVLQDIKTARCVSPDPMMDERLQELRNEAKSGIKEGKKERKFSFRRKKSEENVLQKEAFVKTSEELDAKRKDGKWLSKPSSILKSITGNDTAVSVFKAKINDDENHLDAIEEEEILGSVVNKPKTTQIWEKQKAEVWDIIDEQYYSQVHKKVTNKLKKTVSSESRSSLWSFISTPEDMDDDDLDDILECLPGMTEPEEFRNSAVKLADILGERDKAVRQEQTKKRFSLTDLNKSKFELIDYYEMLKARQITIHDVPEEKREMLLNIVELKREEKLKRDGKTVSNSVLKSDEMYSDGMSPGGAKMDSSGKVKLVSFRQNQSHSSPQRTAPLQPMKDPRLDRARSAPLKRPRTPMHKPQLAKTEQKPPAITVAKRNKARAALKRALNNKGAQNFTERASSREREKERGQQAPDMSVKYATIRKINVNGAVNDNDNIPEETITVPIPTSDSFSFTHTKPLIKNDIKRYSSFSSNESSTVSIVRSRNLDVSLTSGEVSSLSSQAESDHYETDIETVNNAPNKNNKPMAHKGKKPSSRVDSGFDSGSMSSEMSDAFMNKHKHLNPQSSLNHNKGVLNSWARNYKPIDSLPSSPYNFGSKFIPTNEHLPLTNEQNSSHVIVVGSKNSVQNDNMDKASVDSGYVHTSRSRERSSHGKHHDRKHNVYTHDDVKSLQMSPYNRTMSPTSQQNPKQFSRPMSPSRPLSPPNTLASTSRRPMSPEIRPMSPQTYGPTISKQSNERPMSPNVRLSEGPKSRPMSPYARVMSPTTERPFSPGRKLIKPLSPLPKVRSKSMEYVDRHVSRSPVTKKLHEHNEPRVRSLSPPPVININGSQTSLNDSVSSIASRRYRALVKQGVPLRESVIDVSPTRQANEDMESRPGTADSMGRPFTAEELYENLESKGFFANRPRSKSPFKGTSPSRNKSPSRDTKNEASPKRRENRNPKQLPLEELVREKPSGPSKKATAHRSASKNHLAVSEEAYLNQPMTSEESETCSIKTNKSNNSIPAGVNPKVMVDAELVIDRIFSQQHPHNYDMDVEVERALGLDKDPFKSINELYLNDKDQGAIDLENVPLLNGMNQKHIHGCLELVSGLHVITVRDLLPANKESFEVLRSKLQQVGQLGTVGNQLLDVIERCWLMDIPPSSGDLVEQLTDPVTETEL